MSDKFADLLQELSVQADNLLTVGILDDCSPDYYRQLVSMYLDDGFDL